jgi:hypothetical protein
MVSKRHIALRLLLNRCSAGNYDDVAREVTCFVTRLAQQLIVTSQSLIKDTTLLSDASMYIDMYHGCSVLYQSSPLAVEQVKVA